MLTKKEKPRTHGTWKLQDAKARFSEVVHRARTEGPQRVTVHNKDAVVIVSAEEYAKTHPSPPSGRTGADLVAVMQEGRRLGLKLKPSRIYLTARPPIDFSDNDR